MCKLITFIKICLKTNHNIQILFISLACFCILKKKSEIIPPRANIVYYIFFSFFKIYLLIRDLLLLRFQI